MNQTKDILEMSFEPGKTGKFIHPSRKQDIEAGGSDKLKGVLPELSKGEQTYLEYITSETYQKMVDRLEKFLGMDADDIEIPSVFSLMFQALQSVAQKETAHKEELEKLALNTVLQLDEFEMVADAYESGQLTFDVAIGEPELKMPDTKPQNDDLSEAEQFNLEFAKEMENLGESQYKRKLANLLIQGGAMLKMYLFKVVDKEISAIDKDLMKLYETLAVAAQMGYWTFPANMEISDAAAESAAAGSEQPQPEGSIYTIKCRAVCFPFLVHEISKGIYEWIALSADTQKAMEQDTLSDEPEDTTVGAGVYAILQKAVTDQKLLPLVMKKLLTLPTEESKKVLAQDEEGKKITAELIAEAESEWEDYSTDRNDDENYDPESWEDVFRPADEEEQEAMREEWPELEEWEKDDDN